MKKNKTIFIGLLLVTAAVLRFVLTPLLEHTGIPQIGAAAAILIIGAVFVLRGSAQIIEETTEVLSERTKLAGGLLQSLGTAFPDMVLGIVAAIVSLRLREQDYSLAIEYAIIAASTTFGSNIYNIGHAAWCIYRQNVANSLHKSVLMFPGFSSGGTVLPFEKHQRKPKIEEFDTAIQILMSLTLLTAVVAVCMVLFGKVTLTSISQDEDLYQLIRPVGVVIFLLCGGILYAFRKTHRAESLEDEVLETEKVYRNKKTSIILLHLFLSGVVILFTAESMVHAIQTVSALTNIPAVIAGALAGIIGCLGEMLVIHNYSVNPKGRIGDALVGVGMDNIVTTAGAAIVAMMGGIFLGGSSLIVIFVLILAFNTLLLTQVSSLKNFFLK